MKKRWLLPVFASFMVLAGPLTDRVEAATNGDLTKVAYKYIGTPYVYGGTTVNGFDCSGYTQRVFADLGYTIARSSSAQYGQGSAVSQNNLTTGDLVFFNTSGKGVSHVGIYIGNGQFIHSSSSKGVTISKLSESYWASRYIGAKRVITLNSEEKQEVKANGKAEQEVKETKQVKQEVKETKQVKQEVKETQQVKQEAKVTQQVKQEAKVTQQVKQEVKEPQQVKQEVKKTQQIKQEVKTTQQVRQDVKVIQQTKPVVKADELNESIESESQERIPVVFKTSSSPSFLYTARPLADAFGLDENLNESVTITNENFRLGVTLGYRYTSV